MKTKSVFRSAFVNPRLLVSSVCCFSGILPALLVLVFALYPSSNALAQKPTQTQTSAHDNAIDLDDGLMQQPTTNAQGVSSTPEVQSGEIDMAALGIHLLSAPFAPRAATGGDASLSISPEMAGRHITSVVSVVGSNFAPGEMVQLFVNGIFAGAFPANAGGRVPLVINVGAGPGFLTADMIGGTSGREAGTVVEVVPDGPGSTLTVLPGNNSTSANGRAPQGSRLFINTKYLILASEMTASGFSGAVKSVGWRWNVPSPPAAAAPIAQSAATTGTLRVYLLDTPPSTTALASNVVDPAGYTKIIDGTITIPAGAGEINIDVPIGGPGTSVYTHTPGNAVTLLFQYNTTPGPLATPLGAPNVSCINSPTNSLSTYQSQTVNGTAGTFSSFRPETRFGTDPVLVSATAGTIGPTPYLTLKDAFDAINAGTHQGAVTINIIGDTTETATAALNASGSGAAAYTSVLVRPTGGTRTITGSIVGAIIKLNGADNVTIDGRIGGAGRNLTVSNSSNTTATAAIWLSSAGVGAGATNNVIRNLEIACGAPQNASSFITIGILMNGATISVSANGDDNDNNSFIANRIIRSRYGIVTRGNLTGPNLNISPIVTDNIIGPAAFGPDQIGKTGIFMQFDTGGTVSRNLVQFVGGDFANTTSGADRVGIGLGSESWASTPTITTAPNANYTVTRNIVHDVIDERTFSALGIFLGTTGGDGNATNNLVANNFIYNVRTNGTLGDQGVGIGIGSGGNDRVVFNSISMTGDIDPAPAVNATQNTAGIRVARASSLAHFGLTLMDNSILVDVTSNTATLLHYDIVVNTATYDWTGGGLNYNNYYFPVGNPQMRTGGLGTASLATTSFQTLADWQAVFTPPQDANSKQADPLYVSNTSDLHISPSSPNLNMGLTIAGVTDDIDGGPRPTGPQPEIGADEAAALQLTAAVSRKMHDAAGTFDINLPLAGEPGVECRDGSGSHTLVFSFTNSVVSGSASVTSGTGVAGVPTFAGNTMIVPLSGVTDVQKITVTLSNVTDEFGQVLPAAPVSMNLLIGDTNGNKTVNATDIGQTKNQSGVPVTDANFRQDVVPNGTINASDIGLVKSRSGASVP